MAELQETATQEVQDTSLMEAVWGDTPPATATVETTQSVEGAEQKPPNTPAVKEDIVDADEYLKKNLGYENWDAAKKEIEELRKLKDVQPQEFKFANEDSERIFNALKDGKEDEIYDILGKKKQFERVEKLDVGNPKDATELVRMNLKLKHPQLDASEIEDMISETYNRTPKPVKTDVMDDEEFDESLKAWQLKEESIDRKVVRDAKIVRPDVLSLQSKIEIPDIPGKQKSETTISPEDLAKFDEDKKTFLKSSDDFLKTFSGFNATVKDKDVEIPVSYEFSAEEKASLNNMVQKFAENGLNVNAIFADRWLTDGGQINSEQMIKDLSRVLYQEKIDQKYVNDAAAKRLELFLKEKKNIIIGGESNGGGLGEANAMQELQEAVWNT